jgi:hypothetical protein
MGQCRPRCWCAFSLRSTMGASTRSMLPVAPRLPLSTSRSSSCVTFAAAPRGGALPPSCGQAPEYRSLVKRTTSKSTAERAMIPAASSTRHACSCSAPSVHTALERILKSQSLSPFTMYKVAVEKTCENMCRRASTSSPLKPSRVRRSCSSGRQVHSEFSAPATSRM